MFNPLHVRWMTISLFLRWLVDFLPGSFIAHRIGADWKSRTLGAIYSVYVVISAPTNALDWPATVLKVSGLGYHLEYVLQTAPEKLVRLRKVAFLTIHA